MPTLSRNLFPLGSIVATPGALNALARSKELPLHFLARHVTGDWGEVNSGDKQANDSALVSGARLFSSYKTAAGEKIWVITEADRTSTCILLPEDY